MTGQELDRRKVVNALLAERGDLLVVTGLGSPAWDVMAAGDHDRNFYLWGAMGGAAMIGLGLALARPEEDVVVITGDGEQLMALGALATIAAAARPTCRSSCSTTTTMARPACRRAIRASGWTWRASPGPAASPGARP
jgi:thiamine pyrophosphate-dependent acetolactate synthase large subunit-like protein